MFKTMLAELGRVAGWNAGVAFAGLAAVAIAIPAAANADLPAIHVAPVAPAPAAAPPAPQISFAAPLPGHEVDSPFGLRKLPWELRGRLHEGVDIAAPSGEAVHAALTGVMTKSGVSLSYGRYVELSHDRGLSTFYAHLGAGSPRLKPGALVEEGQVIGAVGDSGHSTGAHLHFEVRDNGRPLNPEMLIGRQFASLDQLPLAQAAKVSPNVRLASVSAIPAAFRGRTRVALR